MNEFLLSQALVVFERFGSFTILNIGLAKSQKEPTISVQFHTSPIKTCYMSIYLIKFYRLFLFQLPKIKEK